MTERRTLLLVDLSGIYYAAWFSSGDLAVNAAFPRTLAKVAELRKGSDLVAICCDAPPYERNRIYPSYKANREKQPAAFHELHRRIIERLEADGLLCWSVPGAEADDTIASAAKWAQADGLDVVIASGDKDLLQLVSPSCRVLKPDTGELWGVDEVRSRFGVEPPQIADVLALMGDSSDNIPGIEGVGPKRAMQLLTTFLDIGGVLRAANENDERITPKIREAIVAGADLVGVAKKLVTLRDDLQIDFAKVYEKREAKKLVEPNEAAIDAEEVSTPMPEPETAVAKREAVAVEPVDWSLAIEPKTIKAAWWLAETLFNSRLYQRFPSQEAIFAVIMRGRALGLDATLSLDAFHIIDGKPCMHADLIEGLVHRSGKAEYFELVETTKERATYKTKRKGQSAEERITFTIEDAFDADLVTKGSGPNGYVGKVGRNGGASNWTKYRATMLRHRAKTQLARAVYPDVTLGLYTPDEMSEGAHADAGEEE